ncbi:ATP-binding protein [Candidatus Riflebacteria bacterium]
MDLIPRIFQCPDDSFFLFGPRGTGKSTFLLNHYPGALYIDLLSPENYRKYLARPEQLTEILSGNPNKKIIVIDEIQKVPELLSVIHQEIEKKSTRQFILTGSSSRKLRRGGSNLLGGRALNKSFHPFMACELKKKFSLEKALKQGTIPLFMTAKSPTETLDGYLTLYLKEEVVAEGMVRKIPDFARFLEVISFSQASQLNMSEVAREAHVHRKVVESYVQILEELLIAFRLPVFRKRAKRAVVSHPKFFYFDCGVYKTIRPKGPLDEPEKIGGVTLETLVASHLRAYCDYRKNEKLSLYYWRTRAGSEVDFILYGERQFLAFKVKNSKRIRSENLRGLKAFLDDFPQAKTIFLYRGEERLKKDGIFCLPVEDFLLNLNPNNTFRI